MGNDFLKIYNGEYSKEGYDTGMSDGKLHLAKNKLKFFKVAYPINYAWAFNHSFETFSKNYDIGYTDAQRVNHQIYTSTQRNTMAQDSYEHQISMLNEFKDTLFSLRTSIEERKNDYKRQIEASKNAGFVSNYTNVLEQKFLQFSIKLDNIKNLIERHNNYIDIHIKELEQLKIRANKE